MNTMNRIGTVRTKTDILSIPAILSIL